MSAQGDGPGDIPLNSRVQIIGLTSRPELNGQTGIIVARDPKSADRWHVKLDSNQRLKAFKYENLWEVQVVEESQVMDEAIVRLDQSLQDVVQELTCMRQEFFEHRSNASLGDGADAIVALRETISSHKRDTDERFESLAIEMKTLRAENQRALKRLAELDSADRARPAKESRANDDEVKKEVKRLAEELVDARAHIEVLLDRPSAFGKDSAEASDGVNGQVALMLKRLNKLEQLCDFRAELLQEHVKETSQAIEKVRQEASENHGGNDSEGASAFGPVETIKLVRETVNLEVETLSKTFKGAVNEEFVRETVNEELDMRLKTVKDEVDEMLDMHLKSFKDEAPAAKDADTLALISQQISSERADMTEINQAIALVRDQCNTLKQTRDEDATVNRTTLLKYLKRVEQLEKFTDQFANLAEVEANIKRLFTSIGYFGEVVKVRASGGRDGLLEQSIGALNKRLETVEDGVKLLGSEKLKKKPENGNGSVLSATPEVRTQEMKLVYERMADIVEELDSLQADKKQMERRVDILESRGAGGSAVQAQVEALSECLAESGAFPSARYLAVLHRCKHQMEMKAARSMGWAPEAHFVDIAQETEIIGKLSSFIAPRDLILLRTALGSAATDQLALNIKKLSRQGQAGHRLASAIEAARTTPILLNIMELWEACQEADSAGVDRECRELAMTTIKQGIVASITSIDTSSDDSLNSALELARRIGLDSSTMIEIEEAARTSRHNAEKTVAAQRKLKIAVSWATSNDTHRLMESIWEAQQTGLANSQELRSAKDLLWSLHFPRVARSSISFQVFLRVARPKWSDIDAVNAKAKLEKIGIDSVAGLFDVLRSKGEQGLTSMLRDVDLKVFSEETLKSFQIYC